MKTRRIYDFSYKIPRQRQITAFSYSASNGELFSLLLNVELNSHDLLLTKGSKGMVHGFRLNETEKYIRTGMKMKLIEKQS